jgi:GAF domain-containing protein
MGDGRHRAAGAYARPPIPSDEPDRLEALRRYEILDTPAEQAFDDLTLLAAHICDTPIALVSLIDANRQWFKSRVGLDFQETPRDVAFCAHAIAARETLVVPDTLADERFARNPLVVDEPKIRFYAGAPLRAAEGRCLGTICVIDRVPRQLSEPQRAALEALSRQVMAQLELRHQVAEVKRLAGLLPYCSSCGKLRVDLGDVCPDCLRDAGT